MDASQPEFQLVPIPARHVVAVMKFVSDLEAAGAGAPSAHAPAASSSEWPDAELHRFSVTASKTNWIVTDAFDFLAQSPGTWFSIKEIAEHTDRWDEATVRGVWTHAKRAMRAHYSDRDLPVEKRSGLNFEPPRGVGTYYRLREDQAAQWLRVRTS